MPQRLAVLAPTGRDGTVIERVLAKAAIDCIVCDGAPALLAALEESRAGAVIVAEEAFRKTELDEVMAWLNRQPPWSDIPVILLTKRGTSTAYQSNLAACLGNVTILERPFSPVTLVSAARAALRARARQREAEAHILELAERERDLTEQRSRLERSEARLREANEKLGRRFSEALAEKKVLADIVEGTDAFVQVADTNYRWLAINRASKNEFERIFGVRPEVGMSMLDALDHMPEHRKAVQAVWGRALAGQEFTETGEFGDPDRDRRFYEMKFNTLRDARGERIGAYQFVYDVTERVRDQQRLADAQERMHEMAKLETLGQLTGGVAHDFNNLLTPIVGALDLLHRKHSDDPRSARLILGALEASERATVLVQRLLSFARRQHLEARLIDVGELVSGVRDLVQRSIGSHVEVRVSAGRGVPPARIDPNQLELAILNLAVNASDAMPGGGELAIDVSERTIETHEVDSLKGGTYVCVAVRDSGVGMDAATMHRAVEPFYTTKGPGQGTGLGLSMVHGLAAQSGGTLRLLSEPGRGTTAEIWLPVAEGTADPLKSDAATEPPEHGSAIILLVDDEEIVRRATAEMLRPLGHEVIEASSPTSALKALSQHPEIELLITDYLMPGMRGDELIRKARKVRPDLPALLITGYSKLAATDEGVTRLPKPFRASDIAREIAKLLSDGKVVDLASRRGG